jgi:hypothetical protein
MRLTVFARVAVVAALAWAGCKNQKSTTSDLGICADTCPKECNQDNDCDVTRGELCCDHGGLGKICQSAASCPRFCTADSQCQTTMSEACVRYTLDDQSRICDLPKNGIAICKTDASCQTGEKCCSIYSEPVCLPVNLCPKTCGTSSECNTSQGEICCTTLNALDKTLTARGLCIDPAAVACPRLCTQSSTCRTQDGEVCCNGVCSTSCAAKTCHTSNDCSAQICCKVAAAQASGRPAGVPVPATGAGGSSPGTGGSTGLGGSIGTGGSVGTGGATGTGGAASGDCLATATAIDDMESGTGYICANQGRVGYWFSYKDASSTLSPTGTPMLPAALSPARGNSLRAMNAFGTDVQYAGFGCFLNYTGSAATPGTFNASTFANGIEFYAKGTASGFEIVVQTASTESVTYGGLCPLDALQCLGNTAALTGLLPDQWQLYRVPFTALTGGTAAFNPDNIWSIEFQPGAGSYNLWIDDLGFY